MHKTRQEWQFARWVLSGAGLIMFVPGCVGLRQYNVQPVEYTRTITTKQP